MTEMLLGIWILFNDRGQALLECGNAEQAVAEFRLAAAFATASHGPDHPVTAMMIRNVAVAYTLEGLQNKAEASALQSLRILESRFGPEDVSLVPSLNVLGEALAAQRRWTEARRVFDRAVRLDADGPHGATAMHNLASVHMTEGNYESARLLYSEALRRRTAVLGAQHRDSLVTRAALSQVTREERRARQKSAAAFR